MAKKGTECRVSQDGYHTREEVDLPGGGRAIVCSSCGKRL